LAGGPLTAAAAAGLASYAITTYFLREYQTRKMKREAAAAKLADAYRQARMDAAEYVGRALTKTELNSFATAFKKAVDDNGLTSFFWK
jgi:hypothetical protein